MIAIVIANLTTRYLFNTPSAFLALLQDQGLDYRLEPLAQILTRVSVAKIMTNSFQISQRQITLAQAQQIIAQQTVWVVTVQDQQFVNVFPVSNISSFLDRDLITSEQLIDLERIPAQRVVIHSVNLRATLYEALQLMNKDDADVLCVFDHSENLIGILSRFQIEQYYSCKQYH